MDRNEYFRELRYTSNTVKPIIEKYMGIFRQRNEGIYRNILYLTKERIQKNSLLLKPFLVRLSYELTGGENWEKISPICAAAELINISSYQANLALDGKYELITQEDKNNQFIASMLTREIVFDIVNELLNHIDISIINKILHSLAESNKYIYLGQYYDQNVLISKCIDSTLEFPSYLKLYINKCYYFSGVFSEQCAFIGGVLSRATEDELIALREYGRNFGIGLHIVNDIGDFTPSSLIKSNTFKKGSDQYNDIRHGKLTLPIVYVLKFGKDSQRTKILNALQNRYVSEEDLLKITRIIINTGAFAFSKKLAKDYMKKAKHALINFEPSTARSLLSVMTSQLRSNKYFAALRRFINE